MRTVTPSVPQSPARAVPARAPEAAAENGAPPEERGVPAIPNQIPNEPRLVGISRAAEWVYTGRLFGPDEALAGGLVSRVLASEDLLPAARALAREIADHTSAVSVALSRALLWRMLGADHPMEAHRIDSKCIYEMGRSADAREGVTAFLEKRPARFTMRPSRDMPDVYPWWTPRPFKP